MRKRFLPGLCLLAIALSGVQVHAQSCAALADITALRAVSANCAPDDDKFQCKPDVPTTFVADVRWQSSSVPHCPVQFRWTFGIGSSPVITTEPTVDYVFAPVNGAHHVTVEAIGLSQFASTSVFPAWGSISVARLTQTAREGSTAARVAITRTDTTVPATVSYQVRSYPAYYIDFHQADVTFAVGEGRREIDIPLHDDDVYRGGGSGTVELITSSAGWRFGQSGTSFAIEDDDEATHYQFPRDRFTVSEGAGGLTLPIERTGSIAAADTVVVTLGRPLDATGTREYIVPFAPGQAGANLHIPLINDSTWGPTIETYAVVYSLQSPSDRDTAEIVLTDDEPEPRLATRVIEVTETDATRAVVLPLVWAPNPTNPATVYVIPSDGTAKKEQDYEATGGYIGVPSSPLTVTITGDDVPESDETFTISFGGPFSDTLTVRILDDDRPPFDFAFETHSYTFDEAGGTIGIVRSGATASPATVTLRVAGRTPASWTVPDVEVAFAAGETLKRVPIHTDDHWFTNGREATLELEWNSFAGASAELILLEDEPMPILSLSDADVLEGAVGVTRQAEFTLSLSAPVGADIFLTVSTEHGTATVTDYTPLAAKQVHIPAGATSVKIPVTIHGDNIAEGSESFTLKITSCCSGFAQLANASGTATIREGGAPPDSATYKLDAAGPVSEASDWLIATVTRRGDTSGRSVATVTLTADAARRFTPVTLHFAPGQTKKEVRFAIDDDYRSGDAVALLEVFAGTRRDDKREVTIRDDEQSSKLAIHDVTVYEPGSTEIGQVTFVVTIDPPSFLPIDVDLTTAAGTARDNLEFVSVTGIRRIPSLATRYELPVTIYGDSLLEPLETFTMALRTWIQPGVAASVIDGLATCSIIDNSHGGVKVGTYDPRVARGATSAVTVDFPAGAINVGPLVVTSSDPEVLSVPATVPMTIGATSVTIPVTGVRRGDAKITIALPVYYQSQILEAALSVYDLNAPIVTPSAIAVEAGSRLRVKLSAAPVSEEDIHATLTVADGSIAMVENAVTIPRGGHATFDLAGATPGQTELLVTFESAAGGTTLRVPVLVTSGEGKRRGARH